MVRQPDSSHFKNKTEYKKAENEVKSEAINICAGFLESLDFVCSNRSHLHVDFNFLSDFQGRIVRELNITEDMRMKFSQEELSLFLILYRMREISENVGVPPALLEGSVKLLTILIALHYATIGQEVPEAWL